MYSLPDRNEPVKYDPDGGNIPIAPGLPIPPRNTFKLNNRLHAGLKRWVIIVFCPYCGKQHFHDFPDPEDLDIISFMGRVNISKCFERPIGKDWTGGGPYRIRLIGSQTELDYYFTEWGKS